mmetsp:Transcript_51793/g.89195  ORF Transcript_51793/g.89195 Transcript_51793/m.89195 type:complete len:205 (-) Transcript_51793:1059-1673(-)
MSRLKSSECRQSNHCDIHLSPRCGKGGGWGCCHYRAPPATNSAISSRGSCTTSMSSSNCTLATSAPRSRASRAPRSNRRAPRRTSTRPPAALGSAVSRCRSRTFSSRAPESILRSARPCAGTSSTTPFWRKNRPPARSSLTTRTRMCSASQPGAGPTGVDFLVPSSFLVFFDDTFFFSLLRLRLRFFNLDFFCLFLFFTFFFRV